MPSSRSTLLRHRSLASLLGSSALSLTLLAGCGGGGGGGGDDGFRTAEFLRSTGLDQISADEGYAQITGRQGGAGVTVAVLDNGIDDDHPDLQGVVTNRISVTPDGALVDGDHGTPIAGIIAGRKDDSGTHGVAFNASLIDIQLNNDGSLIFPNANVATGILTAAGAPGGLAGGEADIMNLSLGRDAGPIQVTLDAMREAASRNKIMVFSAGNITDSTGPGRFNDPQFPGLNAIDPQIEGLTIVVGATTLDGDETAFTYRCGIAREFCLFAPGEDIAGPAPGGGTQRNTGTSFSAPLVAGSAAVVKAAFPGISNRAVVQRILDTARPVDINDDGVIDSLDADIAGRGVLDLENALSPQGTVAVATGSSVGGAKAAISETGLSLGSGLALRGPGAALLGKTVAFDADGFPFEIDLFDKTRTQSRDTGLAAFLDSSRAETSHQETAFGTFSFQLAEDRQAADPHRAEFVEERAYEERDERVIKAGFHSAISDRLSVFGTLNQSATVDAGLHQAIASTGGGSMQPSTFLAPYDSLAGAQSGGGFSYALGDDTKLTLGAFTAGDGQDSAEASSQKIELSHRSIGDVELRLGYGWLAEEDRFLGSESEGAFGADGSGASQYLNLSLIAPVTERVKLFGSYSSGWTDIGTGANGSTLFDHWSTVRSEAFGVGLLASDVIEKGDGLTVMVGQPLRVTDGSATVDVPVGRTEDGKVLSEKAKVDLSPGAMEVTTEMAYRFALDHDAGSLSTGTFVRLNPDHDPDADPDVGVGVRYQLKF